MDKFTQTARELVSKMTLEEKCSQLRYDSPAIERLGIPSYNWWSEALHGVARAGTATVFPQAIGIAAAFDEKLTQQIAEAVSLEARAKYNYASSHGDRDIYKGLTLWSPNINIFRDPRWGRGHETYGEDPYLTSVLGCAYVRGLQGDGEYLRTAACAKHFAVHSGPEELRHEFNAEVSPKDLRETYLYAFEKLCKEGVAGVMGAYNRVNNEPACANSQLMDILYNEWGFDGYFVSDCWAISDFHLHHGFTATACESAAVAVKAGCDINCGNTYIHLMKAYEEGLVDESDIDRAVTNAMKIRLRLGMGAETEYDSIPFEVIDSPEHNRLSQTAAEKSAVLLKNNGVLPFDKSKLKSVAVIGPNADSRQALVGNYNGTPSHPVTFLEGIQSRFDGRVYYAEGSHLFKDRVEGLALPHDRISEAVAAAENADRVILCLGLDASLEGEEGDAGNAYASGDKPDLRLPEGQRVLLKAVLDVGKPTVVVIASGSSLNIEDDRADAVIQAWYSGARGGYALADIIFGNISPSGKLPVTFYKSADGLPEFTDYSMCGRTYRYNRENVLYPFGYGLTYTHTEVTKFSVKSVSEGYVGECVITNTGDRDTDEVVQIYVKDLTSDLSPKYPKLCAFKRVYVRAGESVDLSIPIDEDAFVSYDEEGKKVRGSFFELFCGTSQPDELSVTLTGSRPMSVTFEIQG
jgi:beta-glucosidase